MVQLWAFLVSIEDYANPDTPRVNGAHSDTTRTFAYLTDDMRVPVDHVITLKGPEATRKNIIQTFHDHLLHNPRIEHGDAILFHYSGHGTYMPAPAGWTVVEAKSGNIDEDDMIEALVPYDEGVIDDETGLAVCCIPDRTLGALISRVAQAHGNNITIVLDCCSSGHGTRGGDHDDDEDDDDWVARSVDGTELTPLRVGLDNDILTEAENKGARDAGRQAQRGHSKILADHVLMAACGQRESAMGGSKNGGAFTTYWLKALRRTDVVPRTYAEVLKALDLELDRLRLRRGFKQYPQCDGVYRDRLVFEETMVRADHFEAERRKDLGENRCVIQAGEVHGTKLGALFELHEMDRNLLSKRTLGSAVVKEVYATHSVAEFPSGIIWATSKCTALMVQDPPELKYIIINNAPNSAGAQRSVETFRQSMQDESAEEAASLHEVPVGSETADLRLEFEEDGSITLHRLDPLLRDLKNRNPVITADEVEVAAFPQILSGIARFNNLLALTSVKRPFANKVSFELHHLAEPAEDEQTQAGKEEGFIIRELSEKVDLTENEAKVLASTDDVSHEYAIVLHNSTAKPLHAQIWYFDPNTYSIEACYRSAEATRPNLHPGGSLQIGASTELSDPLQFWLPDESTSDTIFAKVFLTDQATKLEYLRQREVVGLDVDGESVILNGREHRGADEDTETYGSWDTLLMKITAVESTED